MLVGHANPRRAWLSSVIAALHAARVGEPLLFRLPKSKLNPILAQACAVAQISPFTSHALRHGGAERSSAAVGTASARPLVVRKDGDSPPRCVAYMPGVKQPASPSSDA